MAGSNRPGPPSRIDELGARLGVSSSRRSAYVRLAVPPRDLRLRPGGDNCFGDRLILLAAAAADANGAHDLAVHFDRDAAREDHHPGVVRYVDAEELVSRLAVAAKLQRRDIKGLRR